MVRTRLPLVVLALALLLAAVPGQARIAAGPALTARPRLAEAPALTAAQTKYLAAAVRGLAVAGRYWGNPRFHWYNALLNDRSPYPQATIWDIVPLFESVDEIALASPTAAHRQAVVRFADHAEDYWDPNLLPGPGYTPYPGSHDAHAKTYFDDNSWLGLAFIDAYRATGTRRYLIDAQRAMGFVIAHGWDGNGGGGLWWNTAHPWRSGEVLGAATDLSARLYASTGKAVYLKAAERYITWANHHLLKWDGSYAEQIPNSAIMPHDGEGAMVAAFTTLCEAKRPVPRGVYAGLPHNSFHTNPSARLPADPASWCSWAESLADHTAFGVHIGSATFDEFLPLDDGPQWDAIYVRGLLDLYSWDHNRRWYNVATTTARRIVDAADSSGRYLRAWDGSPQINGAGPGMLRTHAASVSVLADLALFANRRAG